jgi:hypothetical protein
MTPMVTAPEANGNFFILKPLLDEVVEKLVMCRQMKLSKPVFQHVPVNETVFAMPANETYPFKHLHRYVITKEEIHYHVLETLISVHRQSCVSQACKAPFQMGKSWKA